MKTIIGEYTYYPTSKRKRKIKTSLIINVMRLFDIKDAEKTGAPHLTSTTSQADLTRLSYFSALKAAHNLMSIHMY